MVVGLGAGVVVVGLGAGVVVVGLGAGVVVVGFGTGVVTLGVGAGVVPSPLVPPSTLTSIVRQSSRPLTVATFVTVLEPAGVFIGSGV